MGKDILVAITKKGKKGEVIGGKAQEIVFYSVFCTVDYKTSVPFVIKDISFKKDLEAQLRSKGIYSVGDNVIYANFSISKGGAITWNKGAFSRLTAQNGVSPRIMLAEYVTDSGRIVGYIIMDKQGKISKVQKEALLNTCEEAKSGKKVAFIQNAIYRIQNNKPQLAAYVSEGFPKIVQKAAKPKREAKVAEHIAETKKIVDDCNFGQVGGSAEMKAREKYDDWVCSFTPEQSEYRLQAKSEGIDPLLISSPKQSVDQMKALVAAKKAGLKAEYVADPAFTVEQIEFLTERLRDPRMFEDCKGFIFPEFSTEQWNELIAGVGSGIDVNTFADPELTAEQMYVKRTEKFTKEYSPCCKCLVKDFDEDIIKDYEEYASKQ